MSAAPKKLRDCDQQQRDATLMVATARNAVAAQIDQSHSPGGANVHPHLMRDFWAHASLHLDRFSRYCRDHGRD